MVLIDTHVLIWLMNDSKRLSKGARDAVRQARAESSLAIAGITLWELAWLAENRRISIPTTLETFLADAVAMVVVKPINPQIAAFAVRLPTTFPKDPIDRLIASTAMWEGIPLVTADERIRRSQVVSTIW